MADEPLRMEAEVRDKFSGPLKALRAHLLDATRAGADHSETLTKGMNKAETAVRATARTAQTVLNPALAAVGVTGIGAGVAVAGIANALGSLTGKLSGLGQLSRETGMAADQLRVFQSLAGKFGISTDASSAAAQTFARNMRDIRRGIGETMGFLQGQNPVVATFALKLKGSKNNDEARKLTEDFLEQIPDPQDRKKFAERMFGSEEFGRLGDRHLGSIAKLRESMQQKMGPLAPGAVESAERYERALSDLRGSMSKVGEVIALELVQPAERFTTWIDDLVSGKRKEGIEALRNGMREIGEELGKVPWREAGESAKQMLLSTTALVKPVAESVREIAAAIRSLNEGKYVEAFRHLDGGSGPLARKLAPLPGDDKIEAGEQVDALRGRIATAKEQGGLQADLLKDLEARGDKDGAKRLREAMDANTRHVKTLEDTLRRLLETGATAQKSSVDGDGPFPGARVQTAGLGDARIFGGPGRGGVIPEGQREAARESFRRYLMKRVPGYDGGAVVPTGPDGTIPGLGYRPGAGGGRLPGMGGGAPRLPGMGAGGGSAVGIPDGVEMTDAERNTLGLIMKYESAGRNTMNFEGRRQGLDPNTAKGYTAQGYFQMLNSNWRRLAPGLGIKTSNAMSSTLEEQTRVALALLRESPNAPGGGVRNWSNYNPALRAALARGERAPAGRIPSLTPSSREAGGDADFFPNGAPRVLRPNSMGDAPGITMAESDRIRANRSAMLRRPDILADAGDERRKVGLDDDEVERRAVRDAAIGFRAISRRAEDRLTAAAGRAGVGSVPKIDGSSVTVNVNKAGAETTASVSTEGPAFRDVQMRRGQTMEKAGGS